jgi:hypothetical protein
MPVQGAASSSPFGANAPSPYAAPRTAAMADPTNPFASTADNGYSGSSAGADVGSVLWRMRVLAAAGRAFSSRKLGDVGSAEDGDLVYAGATHAMPLSQLVRYGLLRWPRQRPAKAPCHRVGVFGLDGTVQAICSQSDVVEWVADKLWQLGTIIHEPIDSVEELVTSPVVTVSSLRAAIDCLADAKAAGVPAVGIVDAASGCLVGNLSDSDLRGLLPEQFPGLALPVAEFLCHRQQWGTHPGAAAAARQGGGLHFQGGALSSGPILVPEEMGADTAAARGGGAAAPATASASAGAGGLSTGPPPTWLPSVRDEYAKALLRTRSIAMCSGSDTFGSIIKRLAAQRLHRIYIVDSDGLPTGLVSLTDVLSVLVRSPAETTP